MNAPDSTSLQRLATLQQLAAQQESQAARSLADSLARHAQAEQRRMELLHYELEYAARPLSMLSGVQALNHQAGFMARLREAVRFQADRVQRLEREVEQARFRWVERHREMEKIQQLQSNVTVQLAQHGARREAREMDDLAARSWARRQVIGG